MLVSIIIPVYNVRPYLNGALESVINQTYKNIEILIIDDGSTDGSCEMCDEYNSDSRVTVIHQENKGLSSARNVGLDFAKGDFITFLDPDDFYDVNYIKLMVEAIERDHTDMIVCKYSTVYIPQFPNADDSRALPTIPSGICDRYKAIQALYNGKLNVNVWNRLYKYRLWESIRFSEGHVFEDNEVAYKIMALCNSISVIDNVLYTHRKHLGSITTTYSLNNIRDRLLALSRVEEFIRSNVPNLFSEEQSKQTIESNIEGMIGVYTSSSSENSSWQKFRDELRTSIIARSKEIELKKTRLRAACLVIRFCPWMLKPLYSLYLPLRRLMLNVTGK